MDLAPAEAAVRAAEAGLARLKTAVRPADIAQAQAAEQAAQAGLEKVKTGATAEDREQARLRVEQAKELLEGTSLSLERVVERVGYSDVPAFRRLFLRSVGLSPAQYRQRFRRPAAN